MGEQAPSAVALWGNKDIWFQQNAPLLAVIVCPARSLPRRLKREYKEPMEEGRLLLMSPFEEKVRRMTAAAALTRNRFVAALADAVLIAHAQPGSKTEPLVQEVMEWGKEVYTLDNAANGNLLVLGAKLFT